MKKELFYHDLYTWYDSNHRILPWRDTTNPYYIWISEIILQQTRVDQGLEYYLRFIERFPTVQDLASAHEDEVLRLWQGLGYYSRARNLHKAAQQITNHQSPITNSFPNSYEELRKLPGVGDYTAGAIASFAYNLPHSALDGNVYRVLARIFDTDIAFDTSSGKKHFHQIADDLLDSAHPRLFNSAIMEFGALYCTPANPDCMHCPLQVYCLAQAHHTVEFLPVRKPRPKVKDRYLIYTIYLHNNQTLIHQRQDNDIWKHLWEFPLQEIDNQQWDNMSASGTVTLKHQLSHQRLHARFVVNKVNQLPALPDCKMIHIDELENFALSRLTLRALENFSLRKI